MKRTTTRLASVAAAAVSLAVLAGCAAPAAGGEGDSEGTFASGDSNKLVFATLPDHEGADQDAEPIADWIAEITGKEVEFFPATDYTAVVQGLASGQIDIAQISAFTYFQSQAAGADIVPIGAQITEEGAEPGYYSVALANPAWDGETLADFADEPICFVNPTSTSGFAVPMGGLIGAGVDVADENIIAPSGGSHDLNAAKIAEGVECQVGFAQDIDADPFIASGALVEVDRVIVPAAPIVMQAGLPQEIKDILLAEIADSTQASVTDAGIELNDFLRDGWFGFGKVDDAYYDVIRDLCSEVADKVEACQA